MLESEENDTAGRTPPIVHTRAYQQELLDESLHRNLVIALDTGSGKTHIAVLRMKHEAEHNSQKVRILDCNTKLCHSTCEAGLLVHRAYRCISRATV